MGLPCSSQSIVGSFMMRAPLVILALAFLVVAPVILSAQDNESQQSADCTFEDGKQMVARYNKLAVGKNDMPPMGKPWSPGGSAMTLFTEGDVVLSGKDHSHGRLHDVHRPREKRVVAHCEQEHIRNGCLQRRAGCRPVNHGWRNAA